MQNEIYEPIRHLAKDISTLRPLPKNARKGSVNAIIASYKEFGQVKPIVVRPEDDGTFTVLAGNHQVEAAKRLGWTEIACIEFEGDASSAVAYSLADNRTSELGTSDPSILNSVISEITDIYPQLLENLEWDMFDRAALSEQAGRLERSIRDDTGYVPPVIINPLSAAEQYKVAVEETEDGTRIVPAVNADNRKIATTGSTVLGGSSGKSAIVQYSLVFDNVEQQTRWYEFMKWLKRDPGYSGNTFGERLIDFIDSHANF